MLDFSQVRVDDSLSYQLFFINVYSWDQANNKFISTAYIYVPTVSGTPNDFDFFRTAFNDFLHEVSQVRTVREISLWSDNCSKHFKQRYSLKYLSQICYQRQLKASWNFFGEYHGSGVCDADAATVKHNIHKRQREYGEIITSAKQIMKIAHATPNYIGRLVEIEKMDKSGSPMKQVSTCYKFVFNSLGTSLSGYQNSQSSEASYVWKV